MPYREADLLAAQSRFGYPNEVHSVQSVVRQLAEKQNVSRPFTGQFPSNQRDIELSTTGSPDSSLNFYL
jgi:hypothetical protein